MAFFLFGCLFSNLKPHFFLLQNTNKVTPFLQTKMEFMMGVNLCIFPSNEIIAISKRFCRVWKLVQVLEKYKVIGSTAQAQQFFFLSLLSHLLLFRLIHDKSLTNCTSFTCFFFLPFTHLFVCLLHDTLSQPTHTISLVYFLAPPFFFFFLPFFHNDQSLY